jgi:hypothetical protein
MPTLLKIAVLESLAIVLEQDRETYSILCIKLSFFYGVMGVAPQ